MISQADVIATSESMIKDTPSKQGGGRAKSVCPQLYARAVMVGVTDQGGVVAKRAQTGGILQECSTAEHQQFGVFDLSERPRREAFDTARPYEKLVLFALFGENGGGIRGKGFFGAFESSGKQSIIARVSVSVIAAQQQRWVSGRGMMEKCLLIDFLCGGTGIRHTMPRLDIFGQRLTQASTLRMAHGKQTRASVIELVRGGERFASTAKIRCFGARKNSGFRDPQKTFIAR